MGNGVRIFYGLIAILIITVSMLSIDLIQLILSHEDKVIEGKIIETDYNIDKDYLEVAFDNGESYRLSFYYDSYYTDLTVNSKLILKIYKESSFLNPNFDNVWNIDQIIKVPEDTI